MRDNGTVSGREIELRDGQVIISRADRHGRIVDVNTDFILGMGKANGKIITLLDIRKVLGNEDLEEIATVAEN